ncbi:MAG: glycosyltransferase [Kiritimatiellae bacterium]|nr:glycosyltransferase [Kiritimatiellia bacterium]
MRILSNLAFFQSRVWTAATESVCRPDESPDTLPPWRQVARLLRGRGKADLVVTMGARVSLFYGLACACLFLDSKQVAMEVFPDFPARDSRANRLKRAAFRLVAKRARGMVAAAGAEADELARRLSLSRARVPFVPLYTTVSPGEAAGAEEGGFLFSGGRSWRDWKTLVAAAEGVDLPFVLAVGGDAELPAAIPPNVKVFRDMPFAEYRERLRAARIVAVPLVPVARSTGQVALLEAMAYGKPVVASAVAGVADYVEDGRNALAVPPEDPAAMREAIRRLAEDGALRRRLGAAARADAFGRYALEPYAERLLDALKALAAPRARA